jgi:hypothetical protein
MVQTFGNPDSAGAIFVFKDDSTEVQALREAATVAAQHHVTDVYTATEKQKLLSALGYDPTDSTGQFVYVVHSATRDEFLAELSAWHERAHDNDCALLIYAHMAPDDIGPVDSTSVPGVTWRELAEALPHGISSLWLAGCESHYCTAAWAKPPAQHCVRNWLVCTTTSIYWLPLMPYFIKELSLDPIFYPEQIAGALATAFGDQVRTLQREDIWRDVRTADALSADALDERIATRAYFLWDKREGTRSWDPVSNWHEARLLELSSGYSRFP